MAIVICCDKCKCTNVEEIGTESVEIGYHWEEELYYPWEKKLIHDYNHYRKFKCKDCGYEFKEKY